ncbi:MAG: TonB-dependent receptor [Nibricoccus sp.]
MSAFRPLLALATLIGLCGLASSVAAADEAFGEVQGRVFNASAGTALRNARVVVEGSRKETFTDEIGNYHLYDVPVGPARVTVSYAGLESQTTSVQVAAGQTTQQDFDLKVPSADSVIELEAFTVSAGEMSAQSLALNERQSAPNITNIVAYEEYGDRGDENIGELLRFLPGVSLEEGGSQPSAVSLRGFPSAFSPILLDGAPVAGARGGRTQSLLDISMGNMARVEITKTLTPDMPATGLGGTINLVTKSGLSTKKPVYNYQLYLITDSYQGVTFDGGPRNLTDKKSPKYQEPSFNFSALVPVTKKFAVSFGGSRTWRLKPMERDEHPDTQSEWNYVGGFQRVSTTSSLDTILMTWSAQGGFDWRPTPKDTLTFAASYRYASNNIMRNTMVFTYGAGATGDRTYTQSTTANGTVTMNNGTNQETGSDTLHSVLKYAHVERDWRIDILGSFSKAETFLDDIDNGHFNSTTISATGLKLRGEGNGELEYSNIPVRYSATNAANQPVNLFDGSAFAISAATSNQNHIWVEKAGVRADFTREFGGRLPFTLKTGVFFDRLDRDRKAGALTWSFNPNGLTTVAARNVNKFDLFDEAFLATAPTLFGQPVRWVSNAKFFQLYKQHPEWFILDQTGAYTNKVNGSQSLVETISAAYVRGDLELMDKRLLIVGGLRFEHTDEDAYGPLNDQLAAYQKNPDGTLVDGNPATPGTQPVYLPEAATDTLRRAQLRLKERGSHLTDKYNGLYPSLNVTYKLTDKLYLRGAYSESIGRQDYDDIIPGTMTVNETTELITVTGGTLKPLQSTNYDLSLESYQIKGGFGSIGIFHKDIKNFVGTVVQPATPELLAAYGIPADPTYLGYDLQTKSNTGDAKITGYEFTYTQSLLFLPHWARGFQVFANGTKLELDGSNTADFTGFAPEKYSGGINFVRKKFYVKFNCTYQADTRGALVAASAANGIPEGIYVYQGERFRVGVNAQYVFSKYFAIFASMTDLQGPGFTVQSKRYSDTTPDDMRKYRKQELGSTIMIGVKGTF